MEASKEKQVLVSLTGSVIIFVFYSLYIYNNYIKSDPQLLNDFSFWGKSFLVLIPIAIAAQIIIHIIFAIANKIISKEDISEISDERDKLIELKSIRISHWVFTFGFFLAMGSQALSFQPYVMFVVLVASGFAASLAEGAAQIYYYRKGF